MTPQQITGTVLSVLGMLITALSFQAKKKTSLLIFQTVGSTFYLASYIFSGAGIEAILNVIFLIRNMMNIYVDKKGKRAKLVLCTVLCISYAVSYGIYTAFANLPLSQNLWNLLPVVGSVFGTVAVMNTDIIKLRLWKLGDSACWLVCNARLLPELVGGVIGEIINLISLTVSLIRFKKGERINE